MHRQRVNASALLSLCHLSIVNRGIRGAEERKSGLSTKTLPYVALHVTATCYFKDAYAPILSAPIDISRQLWFI